MAATWRSVKWLASVHERKSSRCIFGTARRRQLIRGGDSFGAAPLASHAICDGVIPEAVQPLQRAVHLPELFLVDAADLLDRADVALIEPGHHVGDLLALRCQRDAHGPAVYARPLVVDETQLHEFLQVVGYVRAEIVAARAQFAGRQLGIANVEEQESLDGV